MRTKKILAVLLIAIATVSCTSKTEFQISNQNIFEPSKTEGLELLNGTFYDVQVFQYINDELAGNIYVGDVAPNQISKKFVVSVKVEKLRIRAKYIPDHANPYKLDVEFVFSGFRYLEKGKNTVIVFDGNSTTVKI